MGTEAKRHMSPAERLTVELHATTAWDDSVRDARRKLGVGETALSAAEQRVWIRDTERLTLMDAACREALRCLGLPPMTRLLYVAHWIACFLKYPRYLRRGGLVDLGAFRLPKNALGRLRDYYISREERFIHEEEAALVVSTAFGAWAVEYGGEWQHLIFLVDATNFPDPDAARSLLRGQNARNTRSAWERLYPPLVRRRPGRPRKARGRKEGS